jgi:hypothetical protein
MTVAELKKAIEKMPDSYTLLAVDTESVSPLTFGLFKVAADPKNKFVYVELCEGTDVDTEDLRDALDDEPKISPPANKVKGARANRIIFNDYKPAKRGGRQ